MIKEKWYKKHVPVNQHFDASKSIPEDFFICMTLINMNGKCYGAAGFYADNSWHLFGDTEDEAFAKRIFLWSYIDWAFHEEGHDETRPIPMPEFQHLIRSE